MEGQYSSRTLKALPKAELPVDRGPAGIVRQNHAQLICFTLLHLEKS